MFSSSRRSSVFTLLVWVAAFGSGAVRAAGDVETGQAIDTPQAVESEAPLTGAADGRVEVQTGEPSTDTAAVSGTEQPSEETPSLPVEADKQAPADSFHGKEDVPYTPQGADTCLKCHDEDSEVPVLALFKTKHAVQADERTPFAQLQCETCHGPGGEHGKRVRRGEARPPIRDFGRQAATPVSEQNGVCLGCHENHARTDWQGSVHQRHDVACASCHRVHAAKDPVLIVSQQPALCLECHKQQRAEIHKASTHPVRYGQMACSDCHEPHGSATEALLKRETLNQTCYACHAEKRGPFLWEHAPVAEDCSLCHRPHGSNHPDLLTQRPPLLCQQCHSLMGHPSVQYTGRGLVGQLPSPRVLAGSCTNCHSQVHGSNHPAGADLSR